VRPSETECNQVRPSEIPPPPILLSNFSWLYRYPYIYFCVLLTQMYLYIVFISSGFCGLLAMPLAIHVMWALFDASVLRWDSTGNAALLIKKWCGLNVPQMDGARRAMASRCCKQWKHESCPVELWKRQCVCVC